MPGYCDDTGSDLSEGRMAGHYAEVLKRMDTSTPRDQPIPYQFANTFPILMPFIAVLKLVIYQWDFYFQRNLASPGKSLLKTVFVGEKLAVVKVVFLVPPMAAKHRWK